MKISKRKIQVVFLVTLSLLVLNILYETADNPVAASCFCNLQDQVNNRGLPYGHSQWISNDQCLALSIDGRVIVDFYCTYDPIGGELDPADGAWVWNVGGSVYCWEEYTCGYKDNINNQLMQGSPWWQTGCETGDFQCWLNLKITPEIYVLHSNYAFGNCALSIHKTQSAQCGFSRCNYLYWFEQNNYYSNYEYSDCSGTISRSFSCEDNINWSTDSVSADSVLTYSTDCYYLQCSGGDLRQGTCSNGSCGYVINTYNHPDCSSPNTALITPSTGQNFSEAPTIKWEQKDTTRYRVEVATTENFQSGTTVATKTLTGASNTEYTLENWGTTFVDGTTYWFRVRTEKVSDYGTVFSDYTSPRSFTKSYGDPNPPQISNISNNQTINYPFTIEWEGATQGRPPYTYIIDISGTTYTTMNMEYPLPALQSGTYTINIKAEDMDGRLSPTSSTKVFNISNDPDSPTITNIAGGQNITYPFNIEWNPPTTGVPPYTYTLKISNAEHTASSPPFSLPPLGTGTHTIQIRSKDAANQWSGYSEPISFSVTNDVNPPTITEPSQGATTSAYTIRWNPPTAGVPPYEYTIEINGNEITNITGTSYTPTEISGTMQNVRIKAKDNSGAWSDYSEMRTFYVEPPNPPTITTPVNNAEVPEILTIRWEEPEGGVKPYSFVVQICSDTQCNNVKAQQTIYQQTGGVWKYKTPQLETGTWTIRIVCRDANNIASDPRTIQVNVTSVTPPSIRSPTANEETSRTPQIIWDAATGGGDDFLYKVRIAKTPTWTSSQLIGEWTVDGTRYTIPTGNLAGGEYYFVRVVAWEPEGGYTSPPSSPRGFSVKQVNELPRPTISSPPSTGIQTSTSPTVSWNSLGAGITYEVQVSTSATFSTITYETETTSLSADIPIENLTTRRYYVRVKGISTDAESPYAIPRHFNFDAGTGIKLECDPPCKEGEKCVDGVCEKVGTTPQEVRGSLVEIPDRLHPGGSFFFRTNLRTSVGTVDEVLNIKIFSGDDVLYDSDITAVITPQGTNRGFTVDIPSEFEGKRGTYTVQITDSRGVVVASAQVEYREGISLDGLFEETTILFVLGGIVALLIGVFAIIKIRGNKTQTTKKQAKLRLPKWKKNKGDAKPKKQSKIRLPKRKKKGKKK